MVRAGKVKQGQARSMGESQRIASGQIKLRGWYEVKVWENVAGQSRGGGIRGRIMSC